MCTTPNVSAEVPVTVVHPLISSGLVALRLLSTLRLEMSLCVCECACVRVRVCVRVCVCVCRALLKSVCIQFLFFCILSIARKWDSEHVPGLALGLTGQFAILKLKIVLANHGGAVL